MVCRWLQVCLAAPGGAPGDTGVIGGVGVPGEVGVSGGLEDKGGEMCDPRSSFFRLPLFKSLHELIIQYYCEMN